MQKVSKIAKKDVFYGNVAKPNHPVKYKENTKIQKNRFCREILGIFYFLKFQIQKNLKTLEKFFICLILNNTGHFFAKNDDLTKDFVLDRFR